MLGFGSRKPKRVTEREMDDIRRKIAYQLDEKEERDVENVFHAALHDTDRKEGGITREEYELGMERLRTDSHLEEKDLQVVERYFEKHLKD